VQARTHPPAQGYVARRQAEGKTWREAQRCLKRHPPTWSTGPCCSICRLSKPGLDEIGAHVPGLDRPTFRPHRSVVMAVIVSPSHMPEEGGGPARNQPPGTSASSAPPGARRDR
jgi:hypothetical protein